MKAKAKEVDFSTIFDNLEVWQAADNIRYTLAVQADKLDQEIKRRLLAANKDLKDVILDCGVQVDDYELPYTYDGKLMLTIAGYADKKRKNYWCLEEVLVGPADIADLDGFVKRLAADIRTEINDNYGPEIMAKTEAKEKAEKIAKLKKQLNELESE